ncbi:MAG: hypothetical protein LBK26_02140, partial [Rickettsiales bacterium]|nr:hypothetical protein [Rickettsiales bacterium]
MPTEIDRVGWTCSQSIVEHFKNVSAESYGDDDEEETSFGGAGSSEPANAGSSASDKKDKKKKDKNNNTNRIIADATAGVVLGAVGGIVTFNIIKKNQIKNGFDDLDCVVGGNNGRNYAPLQDYSGRAGAPSPAVNSGGQGLAALPNQTINWGDEFMIRGAVTKSECEAASGGRNNIFVWASKDSTGADYATLKEDTKTPDNNACWARADIISKDPNINTE